MSAVLVFALTFLAVGKPLGAQATPVPAHAWSTELFTVPTQVNIQRVDVRLLLPNRSDTKAETSIPHVSRLTIVPQTSVSHRKRNAIIGGVIGTVVGLGACTAISNISDDSAKPRISTCTLTGNVIFGAGGFAVGALIGSLFK